MEYADFLRAKVAQAKVHGFDVDPHELNPRLKDHTRAMVRWMLAGGRRGLFAGFGLHKTCAQIECMRLIGTRHRGIRLIALPLGVRGEFLNDAARFFTGECSVKLKFIRRVDEIDGDDTIYLTNYESVREGILDIGAIENLVAVSLDEAAILRGFGGTKTFREAMALFAGDDRRDKSQRVKTDGVPFRFVATATPDPNEHIELLAYAAFLGVMDVGQAKTRFFKRNSEKADALTLHPHKEAEFWMWVASWALFVQKPSDLGFSDEGYTLPPVEVVWHELPSDHSTAGDEKDGQGKMFRSAAIGLQQAAREKRDSLEGRVAKVRELAHGRDDQRIVWCDLNDEQRAIEKVLRAEGLTYSSLTGSQPMEEREQLLQAWRACETDAFVSKPVMYGAGVNLQQCHTMIFAGIGFKFADTIQAVHRIQRFGQQHPCTVHMIYTEAEREVRRELERKWKQHDETVAHMTAIIREYGLARISMAHILGRSIGCERREVSSSNFRVVNNDTVDETKQMEADSVGLIVTSIPFSHQYEYSPSYNDFGHTDDNEHFWRQMDFLTPELLRVLQPGRICAVHVKDRITPGGINGFGFQTVTRISDQCADHFEKHGFAFLARKTITTDVVRENNQTYRLGWSEQCKDGSRMGAGLPEYLLLFRKSPTDRSNGYADVPILKLQPECLDDAGNRVPYAAGTPIAYPLTPGSYSRPRWQYDAHGFMRSSGNRLLQPEDLDGLTQQQIYRRFRDYSLGNVYDFERDVALAEHVDRSGWLPSTFMLMPPASWHPDVWTDVARMRTLNMDQKANGRELHLCPLQLDIVDRVIVQCSNKGDVVYDPFSGIGTVPARAVKHGRFGRGTELNGTYFDDSVWYLRAEERKASMPTLFDLDPVEEAGAV
jgi:DNA modification methylase